MKITKEILENEDNSKFNKIIQIIGKNNIIGFGKIESLPEGKNNILFFKTKDLDSKNDFKKFVKSPTQILCHYTMNNQLPKENQNICILDKKGFYRTLTSDMMNKIVESKTFKLSELK